MQALVVHGPDSWLVPETTLAQPHAAQLAFAIPVLAYDVLALIDRWRARAWFGPRGPAFDLTAGTRSGHEGMMIALRPEDWPTPGLETFGLRDHRLKPARRITSGSTAAGDRG